MQESEGHYVMIKDGLKEGHCFWRDGEPLVVLIRRFIVSTSQCQLFRD